MDFTIDGSVIACAQDFNLSVSRDMIEVQCMNSTNSAKQNIPDLYGYTISGSGLQFNTADIAATEMAVESMMNVMLNSDASVLWAVTPDVSLNNYFEGVGYFSSITQSGGVGAPVAYDFELSGDGEINIKKTL